MTRNVDLLNNFPSSIPCDNDDDENNSILKKRKNRIAVLWTGDIRWFGGGMFAITVQFTLNIEKQSELFHNFFRKMSLIDVQHHNPCVPLKHLIS